MKNIIVFSFFFAAVALSPVVSLALDTDLLNSLNRIGGAINRNTEELKAQRLGSLDQDCVRQTQQYISNKDTALKDIDQEISETRDKMSSSDMGNPTTSGTLSAYLKYLYSQKEKQINYYDGIVSDSCSSQMAPKTIQFLVNKICQEKYGGNSVWSGNKDSNGAWDCDCSSGYQFNSNNQCAIEEKIEQNFPIQVKEVTEAESRPGLRDPELTNDQMCQNRLDKNAVWTGEKDKRGGLVCDCKSGYKQSSVLTCEPVKKIIKKVEMVKNPSATSQSKVASSSSTTTEQVKVEKKSFWSKVLAFFRF